jgi:hypothetical protein
LAKGLEALFFLRDGKDSPATVFRQMFFLLHTDIYEPGFPHPRTHHCHSPFIQI